MDTMLILIVALGVASLAHSLAVEHNHGNIAEYASDENAEWERFKITYSKKYDSTEEEEKRRMIFIDRLRKIRKHNSKFESGEVSNLQGINKFSDMTADEVPKGLAPVPSAEALSDSGYHQPPPDAHVPKEVDWRTKDVVTEVKDQGNCGSCWAFSATGALESQIAIKSKKLIRLSEQNLVDCDRDDGGCYPGGQPWTAFKYVSKYGIASEEAYPYLAMENECQSNIKHVAATDKGWRQVQPTEEALKIAVATVGPISVCINVTDDFMHHAKHVYKSSDCSSDSTRSDHCVLVVGYGTTEKGEDYWLVKNSWSMDWGEKGYIKMARNYNNICGIANTATYPIV